MLLSLHTGRARFAAVASAVCLTALVGCSDSNGGGSGDSSSTPAATTAVPSPSGSSSSSAQPGKTAAKVVIKNFKFKPSTLSVAPGTKVTVTNSDTTTHTMTATKGKAFNTGDIAVGKTVTFTAPSKAGAYPFDCTIHPFMTGTLTVK
ncbi:cupredoxin domain-containing protein [Streptomyces sp. AcH 505]|uniref:cupredoxin domain-containing protein n=1 Tax=Streptomyces sp. AcH 505 TaxID=352211 RepID=UPI0005A73A9B